MRHISIPARRDSRPAARAVPASTSRTRGPLAAAAMLCLCFLPSSAAADIIRLSNGRTMTVEHCRFDGDVAILMMRGGGEVRAPRDLIADILPDEMPFTRTIAIAALAESPSAAAPRLDAASIRDLVDRVAAKVGLDRRLAHAVVRIESNYEPLAISPKGAMGLMQLMPALARTFALDDPFDPEQNLEAGMRHLRRLLSRYSDVRRALAAYNAGEGAVARYGGIPPYRETEQYVQRIMASLR